MAIDIYTIPLPVSVGDWFAPKGGGDEIARVRKVYVFAVWMSDKVEILVDLFLYDKQGNKILRRSPHEGGPKTFEPACAWENWERIEQPDFPIRLCWVPGENGKMTARYHHGAKVLPDRNRLPRKRVPAFVPAPKPVQSDFDPIFEAATRRMTAQNLRDLSRDFDETTRASMIERAKKLEAEALEFSK